MNCPDYQSQMATNQSRQMEYLILLGCLLAWIGVSICLLLIQSSNSGGSLLCPSHAACDAILSSPYSKISGIPTAWLGLGFYFLTLAIFILAYGLGINGGFVLLSEVAVWWTAAGMSFSVSLMFIQFVILHGFCPLCTSSAVVAIALFLIARRCRLIVSKARFTGSRSGAIALAGFALVSLTLLAISASTYQSELQKALARPIRIDLSTAKVVGQENAKVQLVVFSDFQCPVCARLSLVLKQIRQEYPNDVMVAYRYFPIEGHDRAFSAAVAAEAASQQGAFWDYHDHLFSDGGDLSEARFLAIAASLGLDQKRFREGLRSDKTRNIVENSYKDAVNMGLPGTPSLFHNGIMIGGLVTHDMLVKEINQVLHPDPQSR